MQVAVYRTAIYSFSQQPSGAHLNLMCHECHYTVWNAKPSILLKTIDECSLY